MKFSAESQKLCSRYSKATGPSPAMAARKALLKKIQRQELRKLQALVPSISRRRSQPDECEIINETIRYIDQLHATILARVRSGALSTDVLKHLNIQSSTGASDIQLQTPAHRSQETSQLSKQCHVDY